ncbi:hypothetical protein C5F59_027605 [Streptomyces sp. QL37]|uniref:hypothetical protein n=1 Tax=Streptomyces sp. QL37 TaxID=2093747 RepID=UPI000CF2A631|nr:hypothetical protein [Streptomyces sp. QL37]PPQ57122.1 hypothetical protein C5F59_10835 [Streptomyces sp. QL37]
MADQPYTPADLIAEAARQHATLAEDPDFMGVGEAMEDQPCPATDEAGPGLHTWGDLANDEYTEAQNKIHDLITGAADVSAWAVQLGADNLQPEDHTLTVDGDGQPLVRLHVAFAPALDNGARQAFMLGLGQTLADGM